ncbi:MAG: hypothetical protein LBE78_04660 [Burkholderiaceae bacterium]|nr:hypothetical protein [Burkholderiaceae bacterium]
MKFHDAEAEVPRPLAAGDGLPQLMQKNVPSARIQALRDKLTTDRHE